MPYLPAESVGIRELLERFGVQLRQCRHVAGLSQSQLAEHSGVSQSTISRLERGLAPAAAMHKLVLLSDAMNNSFPLGFCPHGHRCAWEKVPEAERPERREATVSTDDFFRSLFPDVDLDADLDAEAD